MLNLIPYENSFRFEALEFQCYFVLRLSKVRKLVCVNRFQVKSTKMGTGRKFVTLQYTCPTFLQSWLNICMGLSLKPFCTNISNRTERATNMTQRFKRTVWPTKVQNCFAFSQSNFQKYDTEITPKRGAVLQILMSENDRRLLKA